MIEDIKKNALKNKVPIIKDDGLAFLLDFIKTNNCKNILELGTAVGYSAICMASISSDIKIDTLEKNEEMYSQALKNIKDCHLESQINVIFSPIEEYKTLKKYDLIFVDAAKAQYLKYTEQFFDNLSSNGYFIYDNMIFHGLIYDVDSITSKNLKKMVLKLINFREVAKNDERFDIMFKDDVGDGIAVLKKGV